MFQRALVAVVLAAALFAARPAYAWDEFTHEVIAALAWRQLTPAERQRLVEILEAAPPNADLVRLFPRSGAPLEERQRRFFVAASAWADLIRSAGSAGHPENRPTWHFGQFYLTPGRSTPIYRQPFGGEADILTALDSVCRELFDPATDRGRAALDLAWLIHLVGDLHQPLHVANRVTDATPDGDRNGNMFLLQGENRNLHSFWDAALTRSFQRSPGESDVAFLDRVVDALTRHGPPAEPTPSADAATFRHWAEEGVALARDSVYAPGLRNGTAPPQWYRERTSRVAAAAVSRAGYRLAGILRRVVQGAPGPAATFPRPAALTETTGTTGTTETTKTRDRPRTDTTAPVPPAGSGTWERVLQVLKWTGIGSFAGAVLWSLAALLALAYPERRFLGREWLIAGARPILKRFPGPASRLLFHGYERRLRFLPAVQAAAERYFALPVLLPDGRLLPPDPDGTRLHQAIADASGPQRPVMLVGKGGAGKSTVLARLTHLALEGRLPESLGRRVPILVPALYYDGDLVQAVAQVLRERDEVPIEVETLRTQLQSGGYLVLFDGISEVQCDDRREAVREIVRTASNADFAQCRFVLTTRPMDGLPGDIPTLVLQGIAPDEISVLLERLGVPTGARNRVMAQLEAFGDRPIEPQLLAMLLGGEGDDGGRGTREAVYERYFRTLLRVGSRGQMTEWNGWRTALETLAREFLVRTGRRGAGQLHDELIDRLSGAREDGTKEEPLAARLKRLFHLPVEDELGLLRHLEAAGLLEQGRRWRFAHDTFEEYFTASYLIAYRERHRAWPPLDRWPGAERREFATVREFVKEMLEDAEPPTLEELSVGRGS